MINVDCTSSKRSSFNSSLYPIKQTNEQFFFKVCTTRKTGSECPSQKITSSNSAIKPTTPHSLTTPSYLSPLSQIIVPHPHSPHIPLHHLRFPNSEALDACSGSHFSSHLSKGPSPPLGRQNIQLDCACNEYAAALFDHAASVDTNMEQEEAKSAHSAMVDTYAVSISVEYAVCCGTMSVVNTWDGVGGKNGGI